jgi:hypothetical protein
MPAKDPREQARELAGKGYSASYIANKTGLSGAGARNVVSNWSPTGVAAHQAAAAAAASQGPPSSSSGTSNTWNPTDVASIFQTLQTGQENLANIQGQWSQNAAQIGANAAVSSAGIRADADKEVAKAYADAQKYASSLGLEGVKYGADKESEWRQAVANIEVKGKLDLQPIINAGLERVAGIEAQASRDVAETTGKYSLESMKQRTAADKSIGKMQLAGSMYGLLGSVFG